MMDIINRLVDNSEFEAYKDGYGQTIITGYARIDGWAVGIVANQRKVVKPRKAKCNLEVLSTLIVLTKPLALSLIATKRKFPLVFVQDVTGFMVGSKSEQGGIIKMEPKW
jgi:acetyl-CoA carboxylase carboxyltransferase component